MTDEGISNISQDIFIDSFHFIDEVKANNDSSQLMNYASRSKRM
jgi:hypothetical protein